MLFLYLLKTHEILRLPIFYPIQNNGVEAFLEYIQNQVAENYNTLVAITPSGLRRLYIGDFLVFMLKSWPIREWMKK